MNAKVTIGLCVKNGEKVIKAAFDSISIQDYPHKLMKLVIVDDGSSDNTLLMSKDFSKKIDIPTFIGSSGGKGLGTTRQLVVDMAEGEYLVWIDDDFVLRKDFISNHVRFMEKNPKIGAARCSYLNIEIGNRIIDVANYSSLLFSDSQNLALIYPDTHNLESIGTGGSIFRLDVLKKVGGFDIRIKGAGEDIDISRRIRDLGWMLQFNNSARFYKIGQPKGLKAVWLKNSWYGYGNHFLFHKLKDRQLLMGYFPPMVIWVGFKLSYLIYRIHNKKKDFIFVLFHLYSMLSNLIGFMRSHREGYGHFK